jgi:hypothetical protein
MITHTLAEDAISPSCPTIYSDDLIVLLLLLLMKYYKHLSLKNIPNTFCPLKTHFPYLGNTQ